MKKISQFDRKFLDSENRISCIGTGSLGGKAQGLAFSNDLLTDKFDRDRFKEFDVNVPRLTVILTDVFDTFMKRNKLYDIAFSDAEDSRIAHAFNKADLPFEILGDLRALVNQVRTPLAVRSSSRLEDAMYEPFAGIYATKMTPNNQPDADSRFRKLVEAVKLVYASTYFKSAKDYIQATRHDIKDESMAVIIQEIAGSRFGNLFYPEVSGVGRSFNFYPMGRAKPEDGVVNLALGLGKSIVDGGLAWTYSPKYPKISPPFASAGDMLKQTQNKFWAVNMGRPPAYDPSAETEYMIHESITAAEKDGTLKHTASTMDRHSGRIVMGTGPQGPRILNFAPLLCLNDIPLNKLLAELLVLCEQELNAPVEIEFAVTFQKDKPHRFGFLQVRPMVVSNEKVEIDDSELFGEDILVSSKSVLGNGVNNTIKDIIYVKPEKFEAKFTQKIAFELETVNKKMVKEKRPYLLIGFGRWGSSDPWLGIPVNWGQISGVAAIVEAGLENMNVDLSQGSHFFHNLTSFCVSYFSIPFSGKFKINWQHLESLTAEDESDFVRCVKLDKPLQIKIDGQSGKGLIAIDKGNSHGK